MIRIKRLLEFERFRIGISIAVLVRKAIAMKSTTFLSALFAATILFSATRVRAVESEDAKRDERLRIELEQVDAESKQERFQEKRFQEYVTQLAAAEQADARNRPPERGIDDSKFYKSFNPTVLFTW